MLPPDNLTNVTGGQVEEEKVISRIIGTRTLRPFARTNPRMKRRKPIQGENNRKKLFKNLGMDKIVSPWVFVGWEVRDGWRPLEVIFVSCSRPGPTPGKRFVICACKRIRMSPVTKFVIKDVVFHIFFQTTNLFRWRFVTFLSRLDNWMFSPKILPRPFVPDLQTYDLYILSLSGILNNVRH